MRACVRVPACFFPSLTRVALRSNIKCDSCVCSTCKAGFTETVETAWEILAQRPVLAGIGKAFIDIPLTGLAGETFWTGAGEIPHQIMAGAAIVAGRWLALIDVRLTQSSCVSWPAAAGVGLQGVVGNKDHWDAFFCLNIRPDTETPLAAASILARVACARIMVHRIYLHPALSI